MRNFNLKSVLVVDVEATCWEPKPLSKSKEFESEIIEIGVCEFFLDKGISNKKVLLFVHSILKLVIFAPD